MRRCVAVLAATMGLSVLVAAPAGSQESVLDLPQLGFEIAQTSGFPGDVVHGTVDVADVAEYCTTVAELQGNVSSSLGMVGGNSVTVDTWLAQGPPSGYTAAEQELYGAVVETLGLGVVTNISDAAVDLWLNTHVFAFAEIATEEILNTDGRFDPATGLGSIVVPHFEPGAYALASACAVFESQGSLLDGGLATGLATFWNWIDVNGIEIPEIIDPLDPDWQDFVRESAFEWVPDIVTPRAVGIQIFCILNPDGTCPGAEDIPLEELELELAEVPAAPVAAAPRFTG